MPEAPQATARGKDSAEPTATEVVSSGVFVAPGSGSSSLEIFHNATI